jgi:cyclophilin family peptidyl-prolyl cis-trans isomerase
MTGQGAAPVVTIQPQDATVNVASAAQFFVAASGAVSCQWRSNGSNIPNATNTLLDLDNVTNGAALDAVLTAADKSTTTTRSAQLNVVPGTIVQVTFSGFMGGGSSNLTLQLFDHDKPATVQNFIHYLTSGAYSNMFMDRLLPGFVLQGGSYDAANRTNAALSGFSITQTYVDTFVENPPLISSLDNEFNVGPVIHNGYGTVAMAKKSGDPDSAESAFFFNLANNSANLDFQNSGFTVFGRVTSGTNILNYFNRLSKNGHGIYDDSLSSPGSPLTDVPVNYTGLATPGNANLVYVDFQFLTVPPVDTAAPTAAITAAGTNTGHLIVSGTAADNIGVARVLATFIAQPYGVAFSPRVNGTTQWTLDAGVLPAGTYHVLVNSQDGAGNASTTAQATLNIVAPFAPPIAPSFQSSFSNGSSFWMTWNPALGQYYQVQYSTNLAPGGWLNLGGPSSNGYASDPLASGPRRFYRLQTHW